MRTNATVLNVVIASPSDVAVERDTVERAILDWNASHLEITGIILHPVRWEFHTFPASGDRPQAIINRQIVSAGDILIGIFGYKAGTPTGAAQSGTIEEIEEFRAAGKYVALYFSTADIPRSADRDQLLVLEAYQNERKEDTLYFEFEDASALRDHLNRHLPKIVNAVHQKKAAPSGLPETENKLPDSSAGSSDSQRLFLADLVSELEDNFDCASRPRTGDVYRRPSISVWLANRNKLTLPFELNQELKNAYNRTSAWLDVVNSGLSPNLGNMQMELTIQDLRQSLPSLIKKLKDQLNQS